MSGAPGSARLPAGLARTLRRRVAETQRAARVPAVSAAVGRGGEVVLTAGAGDPPPDADVQFRVGSVTKTFTAVLVLQLRNEGRLALDDPLDAHLPGTPFGRLLLRDLLGHLSGLTREPPGRFWEAVPGGTADELLAGLRTAEAVLPSRRAFHYSNLGYGLLGLLVERYRGAPFAEVVGQRLGAPLGLRRTTATPVPPYAPGYRVHPHADVLTAEPVADTGAMAAAGQLWSTPADLCRWGRFLADPDPAVLAPATAAEMWEPVAVTDPVTWAGGYGLGLQLTRRGERVLGGHGGSMPGYVCGLAVSREGVVAAVCGNAWFGRGLAALAVEMADTVIERDPPAPVPWRPSDTPDDVLALLGPWYYRGAAVTVTWGDGELRLAPAGDPEGPVDVFARVSPEEYRGTGGGNRGERLVVERDGAGLPLVLEVATWRLTRSPDDPRGGP